MANKHDEFAGEALFERDAAKAFSLVVKGERAMGDKAHAVAEGDEIDDEIEIVGGHRGSYHETVRFHPLPELDAGSGGFIDEDPVLFFCPRQDFPEAGFLCGRGGRRGWRN